MFLYELITMNNASRQYWNESLSLYHIKDSMRPAFFAQQFINKETFHGDIFSTNYRFYRSLDMLEAYEDSESKDWDDYMKKNYFFFDTNNK